MQLASIIKLKCACINAIFKRTHVKMVPWRTVRYKRECYLDPTRTPYTDRHNMAEFMREHRTLKPWQKVIYKDKDSRYNDYVLHDSFVSDPVEAKKTSQQKLKNLEQSLKDRGSARESAPYTPPTNVGETITSILAGLNRPEDDFKTNMEFKCTVLVRCQEAFNHQVPTSYLNDIVCIQDLVDYYNTPVRGTNPYSAILVDNLLPPNLSLIAEPIRFDSETDTFFKGYTATPGLISKVEGLRAKEKYPVLNQKEFQWPDI